MQRPALSRQDDDAWYRRQDQSPHQCVKTPFHPAGILDAENEEANSNLGQAYDQVKKKMGDIDPLQASALLLCAQVVRMAASTFTPLKTVEDHLNDKQDSGKSYGTIVPA